jgi:tetratricopeptide (TPR) repeat protein
MSTKRFTHGILLGAAWMIVLVAGSSYAEDTVGGTKSPFAISDFNNGVQRFNAGQFEEAIPFFEKALSHDDQFAQAYYARGVCYREMKQNDSALSDLNAAITMTPSLLDARALRGVILYEAQQGDQALEDFNYVLERRPGDAQSLLARGVLYLNKGKVAPAQTDFRRFLRLYPNDPLAPKLHKLLASLGRETEEAEGGGQETSASAAAPVRTPTPSGVSEASQRMAADLLLKSHELTNSYNQKIMRGENAQAVGQIEGSEVPVSPPQ